MTADYSVRYPPGGSVLWYEDSAASRVLARSFFGPVESGRIRVWIGGAWDKKPVKVWTGSVWAIKPLKYHNGFAFVSTN
ncbi:MAG: hypothetical protein DDT26_00031 [Dehalococcoidia bacterium]|nr:hypothetical protein [Chloroflexota bacterium]